MAIRLTKAEREEFKRLDAEIHRWDEIHKRASQELASRLEEFKTLYPDKWVAVYAEGDTFQHFAADTSDELLAKVDELGIERPRVARWCLKKKGIWAL